MSLTQATNKYNEIISNIDTSEKPERIALHPLDYKLEIPYNGTNQVQLFIHLMKFPISDYSNIISTTLGSRPFLVRITSASKSLSHCTDIVSGILVFIIL